MYEGNQSCIKWALEGEQKKSKQESIKCDYAEEVNKNGDIPLVYCPSEMMTADIFTNPLENTKFSFHKRKLGLILTFPDWE